MNKFNCDVQAWLSINIESNAETKRCSVADPDKLFRISDPRSPTYISESLVTIFWRKIF
jgi:hypothetical protein